MELQDENDYKLNGIINDKKFKIISSGNQELIKVFVNDKEFCSKNLNPNQNLLDIINILKSEIKQYFIFLDLDCFDLEKQDEKDYMLKDILNEQKITINLLKVVSFLFFSVGDLALFTNYIK